MWCNVFSINISLCKIYSIWQPLTATLKVNCYFFSSLYVSFFFFQCNHRSDYHRYRDNRRNSRDYRQKEWVLDPSYIPFTHLIYLTSERLFYIPIFFATLHYWVCMKNKYSFFKIFYRKCAAGNSDSSGTATSASR